MTWERDVDRVLEGWMQEGPDILPDRLLTDALARVDRTPQRLFPNLAPVRPAWLVAGAVLVLLIAAQLVLLAPQRIGPAPSPTARPSLEPSRIIDGEGQTVIPDEKGCPVEVVNELLPVDDDAEPTAALLSPPYRAEMGWRYGGAENRQLAAVVISATVSGATILEHTPVGSSSYSQELTAEELKAGVSRSLSPPGLHHFSLRTTGGGCSQSFTIEALPDSQIRAIDRLKGGSRIEPAVQDWP